MKKTKPIELFYPGLDESPYYRIPSLVRLKSGDIIAGADQRQTTESDYGGAIEPVIRIKESGKDDFSDIRTVFKNPSKNFDSPTYTIDMSIIGSALDDDRVYMLIDKFKSAGNYGASKKGSGYIKRDGKYYLLLFEHKVNSLLFNKQENRFYLKDGKVYTLDYLKTDYTVKVDPPYPYDGLGDLYEGNELIGNIYSDLSPIQVHQRPYLWFTYSDDNGKTFNCPVDITSEVVRDDMMFLGTCPGRGLQLKSGRLIFPVYYTVENPDDIYQNKEKTSLIYSDDFGKTWSMSNSPSDLTKEKHIDTSESQLVELSDGRLIMFSRTTADRLVYAISLDKGESFSGSLHFVEFESEPFCMVSAVRFIKDNKDYILISNPSGPGRTNGSIKVLEVVADELKLLAQKEINQTHFTYSVIEKLNKESEFALVYEEKREFQAELRENILYMEFDLEWLLS